MYNSKKTVSNDLAKIHVDYQGTHTQVIVIKMILKCYDIYSYPYEIIMVSVASMLLLPFNVHN